MTLSPCFTRAAAATAETSNALSATLASPSQFSDRNPTASSLTSISAEESTSKLLKRPLSVSLMARSSSTLTSGGFSGRRANTRHRESSGVTKWKLGFSVVAPTKTTVPSSIRGRRESCWDLLKRWTSSTKSKVPLPSAFLA
ncbi:hypothetical protein MLD38_023970 [Melastoma candidum]|uniref:Uncharacterized protein n=1 Tax=Melastoma candidum TaxID=119954 RepID=A0ACB9NTT5_9MYRT|nr:hypothetical protein MLD38_023970 [Melastoma candidum]